MLGDRYFKRPYIHAPRPSYYDRVFSALVTGKLLIPSLSRAYFMRRSRVPESIPSAFLAATNLRVQIRVSADSQAARSNAQ